MPSSREQSDESNERRPLLSTTEHAGSHGTEDEDDLSSIASIISTTTYIRRLLVRILELNPITSTVRSYEALPDDVSEANSAVDSGLSIDLESRQQALFSSDTPTRMRIAQVVVALLSCLLTSGVTFGYAALKPVLIDQNVYVQSCSQLELEHGVSPCYYQNLRLDLIFATAVAVTSICPVPIGYLIVAFGSKRCGMFGNMIVTLGAMVVSTARYLPFDGYAMGFFLLALGGPMVYLSSFHLSNAFPKHCDAILTSIACSYELSGGVFLGLRILRKEGVVSLAGFFTIYAVLNVALLLTAMCLMPSGSYELKHDGPQREDREGITDQRWREGETAPGLRVRHWRSSNLWGALHHASAIQQIFSPWFLLITLVAAIQTLRNNHIIASMLSQYQFLVADPTDREWLSYTFQASIPIGGAIAIPISNFTLDRASTTSVMILLTLVPMIFGTLQCLRNTLISAYVGIAMFTLCRPFLHFAVSDYAAQVFGFTSFPTVTGLISVISGLGSFLQVVLDILTHFSFRGNPIPVNVILTSASSLFSLMMAVFVWWESRLLKKRYTENIVPPA